MKFVFIGGTYRGFALLKALVEFNRIPDQVYVLKEDAHEVTKSSEEIIKLAENYNIDHFLRRKLNQEDEARIMSDRYDFGLICGWRTLINPALNDAFSIGLVAAHDSLLPKYRGFAPLNWAIINGEEQTGVTLFVINDGMMDSGLILEQEKVEISLEDYAIDVYHKIVVATCDVVFRFINKYIGNKLKYVVQDEECASYTCCRIPADGRIDFDQSYYDVYNFIRALAHPYPGASLTYKSETFLVRKASLGPRHNLNYVGRIPGRVISISLEGIEVLCKEGSILIEEWENKKSTIVESPSIKVKSVKTTFK